MKKMKIFIVVILLFTCLLLHIVVTVVFVYSSTYNLTFHYCFRIIATGNSICGDCNCQREYKRNFLFALLQSQLMLIIY
jgi:hypothetical protein